MTLRLDWCPYRAAKFACTQWHYSGCIPLGRLIRVGVWEDERFLGVVVFSRGASNSIGRPFDLEQTSIVELSRIALRDHDAHVSRIVSIALKMLKRNSPGLRLVVSYADPRQDHLGIVYQASNWIYLGQTADDTVYVDANGRHWHSRLVSVSGWKMMYGGKMERKVKKSDCTAIKIPGKFKYAMPLDREMRAQIAPLAQPYPRAGSIVGDASVDQTGEGGSTPTPALT